MTTEEKAKAYDEALEKAKKYMNDGYTVLMPDLFPELKDNEDKRIINQLIDLIQNTGGVVPIPNNKDELLDYLEKQKKLDGAWTEEDDAKVKAMCEEGDLKTSEREWLKNLKNRIVKKEQNPAESDAIKGGDFISDGKRVFLVLANVKERNFGETNSTFCEGHILGVDGVVYCNMDNFKKFKQATSDERAKFIHDLNVGVELKEQPTEWNEDYREEDLQTRFAFYTYKDEDNVLYLSNVFVEETSRNKGFGTKILVVAEKVAETIGATNIRLKVKQDSPANAWYREHGYDYMISEDGYDWLEKTLKYLKPNKPEWSEEDERRFISCMGRLQTADGSPTDNSDWFEEHCYKHSSWKPSKEQMEALKETAEWKRYSDPQLFSLYEDIKNYFSL